MNIYFSDKTGVQFRDYMFDYLTNVAHKEGYAYDKTKSFEEKEALMNKAILGDVERVSGVNFENIGLKPEVLAKHPSVQFAAFAVVGQLIDTVLPDVVDKSIGLYADTQYGDFGTSFRFDVESNDLFFVSKTGRDHRTVEFQRQFEGTQYITPVNHSITVFVNLFRVLCGMDSLAKFVMKAILSIEANMTKEVYQAFSTAMEALPSTPAGGELKITAAGGVVDKTAAIKLAERVSAFNGGATPIFVGTKVALSHVFPSADSGFRYDDSKIAYFRNTWGIDTLELPQIADYKAKYKLALDDDKIFVICPSMDKPIKICYEGSTMSNTITDTASGVNATTLDKSYGIGLATNAVAGLITLSE